MTDRDNDLTRLAERLDELTAREFVLSPWWVNGIPPSSKLVIDTCVWMDESPRVSDWFSMLKKHARQKGWEIRLLKSVYEEMTKFRNGKQGRKASLAKKRVSDFQDSLGEMFVIEGDLKYVRESKYADKEIMKYMLSERGQDCLLFTLDRDLKIRLKQIAAQKGIEIKEIRCVDNFPDYEWYYFREDTWGNIVIWTESRYKNDTAYKRKELTEEEAITKFIALAWDQNNAEYLVESGDCFYTGTKGYTQDYGKALRCYRRSAETAYHWGYYNIGKCYIEGKGVEKNDDEARKWFRKAIEANPENFWAKLRLAELGDAESMSAVGDSYYDGHDEAQGCSRDVGKALYWYRRSAELGYHWGCFNVGKCYLEGQGVDKDDNEARKWFRKALELHENLWALYWLAEMGDTEAVVKIVEYRAADRIERLLCENDIAAFLKMTEKYV